MLLISIIVPVYNAEGYLARGIDSILAQSYKDFELILVDDGSKDDSGAICDDYARHDSRVKVIHQQNAGVSAARNAGLKAAQGEWVTFVDSDDLVLDCFLESLVNAVSRDDQIDLAYCGYAIVERNTTVKTYRSASYIGKEAMRQLFSLTNLLYRCSPWAKLFRLSIIKANGLEFDRQLQISEDRLFIYNYLEHVRGIATSSVLGYLYGSFSPTSLKHKRVSTEMLAYRQQSITTAARQVVKQFGLERGGAYLISRHLVLILFEVIRNVYYDSGVSANTVKRQQQLFDELFDAELYKHNLEGDKRWQRQLKGNSLLRCMLDHQFARMNRKLKTDEVNLSIRRFAYRMLKQRRQSPTSTSFAQAVSLINEEE